jgi:uncharacterized protein
MAITLYVTSTRKVSGKTALCVGLMHWLGRAGYKVGYLKPLSTTVRAIGDRIVDEDSLFVKATFGLADAPEIITPIHLTEQAIKSAVEYPNREKAASSVLDAYQTIAKDRDVVVMEGTDTLLQGSIIGLTPPEICGLTNAKAIVIVPFNEIPQVADDLLFAHSWMGASMIGGLINNVPTHRITYIDEKMRPFVEKQGVTLLGTIPRKKVLRSVSIAELVEELTGEVLCCESASDELVEAIMVGAMTAESALTHFRRVANKAVITGGDRPDIQLAALETSTKCLILTGNLRPSPLVIGLAEERGVPIILTRHDTMGAIEIVDSFFGKSRFHQQKKIDLFEELLDKHLDFSAIQKAAGLKS